MAFVWLLPAALHSGVLPSVLVLSTVAVFQMRTQLQHGAHCGLDQQMRRLGFLTPKKVWKNQIEGRREPGEWVGELTSCLTAVYDEAR